MYSVGTHRLPLDSARHDDGDPLKELWRRVMADYEEMPGLSVTAIEAARLWGVTFDLSERVLASLTASGYLRQASSGYVRASGLRSSVHQRWEHLI